MVGETLGKNVGLVVGKVLGAGDGLTVGSAEGENDGIDVGDVVALTDMPPNIAQIIMSCGNKIMSYSGLKHVHYSRGIITYLLNNLVR